MRAITVQDERTAEERLDRAQRLAAILQAEIYAYRRDIRRSCFGVFKANEKLDRPNYYNRGARAPDIPPYDFPAHFSKEWDELGVLGPTCVGLIAQARHHANNLAHAFRTLVTLQSTEPPKVKAYARKWAVWMRRAYRNADQLDAELVRILKSAKPKRVESAGEEGCSKERQ